MDFQEKARLNQLGQKINIMKGLQLSEDEITKSFDKEDIEIIEKARSHKYIRKEGDRYVYEEAKGKHSKSDSENAFIGHTISVGDNGIKYKVDAVINGKAKLEQIDEKDYGIMKTQIVDVDMLKRYATIHGDQSEKKEAKTELANHYNVTEDKLSKLKLDGSDSNIDLSRSLNLPIDGTNFSGVKETIKKIMNKSLTIDIEKSEDSKEQRVAKILAEYKASGELTEEEIQKALETDIEKAKSGVYENTPENLKLGRVGQKYGHKQEKSKIKEKKPIDFIKLKEDFGFRVILERSDDSVFIQCNKNNSNIGKTIDILKESGIKISEIFVRDYWGNETEIPLNTSDFSKYSMGKGEEGNDVQIILKK